jgi:hypothetical protein
MEYWDAFSRILYFFSVATRHTGVVKQKTEIIKFAIKFHSFRIFTSLLQAPFLLKIKICLTRKYHSLQAIYHAVKSLTRGHTLCESAGNLNTHKQNLRFYFKSAKTISQIKPYLSFKLCYVTNHMRRVTGPSITQLCTRMSTRWYFHVYIIDFISRRNQCASPTQTDTRETATLLTIEVTEITGPGATIPTHGETHPPISVNETHPGHKTCSTQPAAYPALSFIKY